MLSVQAWTQGWQATNARDSPQEKSTQIDCKKANSSDFLSLHACLDLTRFVRGPLLAQIRKISIKMAYFSLTSQ
jgi:hypothetical protein